MAKFLKKLGSSMMYQPLAGHHGQQGEGINQAMLFDDNTMLLTGTPSNTNCCGAMMVYEMGKMAPEMLLITALHFNRGILMVNAPGSQYTFFGGNGVLAWNTQYKDVMEVSITQVQPDWSCLITIDVKDWDKWTQLRQDIGGVARVS